MDYDQSMAQHDHAALKPLGEFLAAMPDKPLSQYTKAEVMEMIRVIRQAWFEEYSSIPY